jgi:16S rRNA (guanine527-N7)-methyltransferase
MEQIRHYFPDLSEDQIQQFEALQPLYEDWNSKINVISRKDMEQFYTHHVLHSLAIAKVIRFSKGTKVLDLGTGGGFPGIPLAILFPDCKFHLVDSIGKKIKVVNEVSKAIGLKNIKASHKRAEQVRDSYDFVVTRAVARLQKLIEWSEDKIYPSVSNPMSCGLLALKGGDLKEEIKETREQARVFEISDFFDDAFFETKKVVYVAL